MNHRSLRAGLIVLFVLLAVRSAAAEPSLRLEAGATTHQGDDMGSELGFTFGGSLALTRWTPAKHLALVPQVELLLARRNTDLLLAGVEHMPLINTSLTAARTRSQVEAALRSIAQQLLAGGF